MFTNDTEGIQLGTQTVIANTPFNQIVPTESNNGLSISPFPGNDDLRQPNVMFDTDNGWRIIDGPTQFIDEKLNEQAPYGYGEDLTVKATWWKKIATSIFAYDTPSGIYIDEDLTDNVSVVPSTIPYHSLESNRFNFFGGNEHGTFSVTPDSSNSRIVTGVSTQPYYFLYWTPIEPDNMLLPEVITSRMLIDGRELTLPFNSSDTVGPPAIIFPRETCKKNETALFLFGTTITLHVYTNSDRWNDNGKFTYSIEYEEPSQTHGHKIYSKLDDTDHNAINVPMESFGYALRCCPDPNQTAGVTQEYIESGYQFRGWYYGKLNLDPEMNWDPDNPSTQEILNSGYFWESFQEFPYWSHWAALIHPDIKLTVIYTKAVGQQYTITYYSGLENPE